MNNFPKTINKYIIILIGYSLLGMPWMYIRYLFIRSCNPSYELMTNIESIPTYIDYLIRIIVVALLIFDFKKYQLKNAILSCIAALFFPLLGIVVFAIMFLLDEKNKTCA